MKNQKFTQFLSCAALFAIMTSFTTACSDGNSSGGNDNNNNNNNRTVQTADQVISNSYASVPLEISEDIKGIQNMVYSETDNVYYCLAYVGSDYDNVIYSVSPDFSEFKKFDIKLDDTKESYMTSMNVLNDGGFALFLTETSYGDLPLIDYSDETIDWENFDFTPYEEARETEYIYRIYDKDGTMKSSTNLNYQSQEQYDYISGYYGFSDGSCIMLSDSQGVIKCDASGKGEVLGNIEGLSWVDSINVDSEGNIIVFGYGDTSYAFMKYDIDSKSVSEVYDYEENVYNSQNSFVTGTGDYSFFVIGESTLSGYNKNTKQFEEIVNWVDSDISNPYIALIDKDMQIIIAENTYNFKSEVTFSKLEKRDPSELANQQIITLGMLYTDTDITSMVAEFNKSNKDYRIKTVDYSKYDSEENEYTGAVQQLNTDLISGNAPDIIISSDGLNMQSLASKGVFADLYEFIDKDEELNRDSFIQNVLKLNEYDGRLVRIGSSFSLQIITGKTKYVGNKQNWTIDDMISAYDNRPDKDMKFSINDYKTSMFYTVFYSNLGSHIDYKNKTFTYDKDELVKALEFVNQFEDEPNREDETVQEENQAEWNDYQVSMIKDKYLVQNTSIYDFRSYHELTAGTFANEPITFVGYPTENETGTKLYWNGASFSIVSNSSCKDAAWSFIRQFLLEEYQSPDDEGNTNIYCFPINQNAFDKLAEQSKSPRFWIDSETGEKREYESTYRTGSDEIEIGDITDEEIAQVKDLINNVKTSIYFDYDLIEMCEEEAQAYFNGDKTAEETADIIINRISIYVAEKG